jgi:hypothetical protein
MKGAGVRSDRICSSTSRAKGAGPIISGSRDLSTTRPKRRPGHFARPQLWFRLACGLSCDHCLQGEHRDRAARPRDCGADEEPWHRQLRASALRPIWPPSKHIPEMNTVLMSRYSGIATAPISTTKGIEMMNAITMEIIPTRSKSRPTMRLPSAPHQLLDPKRRRSREFGRWWLWCRFTARHPPERSGRDR